MTKCHGLSGCMKIMETPNAEVTDVKDLVQTCPTFLSTRPPHADRLSTASDEAHTHIHSEAYPATSLASLSARGATDN